MLDGRRALQVGRDEHRLASALLEHAARVQIVDVREAPEFIDRLGHLPGARLVKVMNNIEAGLPVVESMLVVGREGASDYAAIEAHVEYDCETHRRHGIEAFAYDAAGTALVSGRQPYPAEERSSPMRSISASRTGC